jgi:hypothetical protein
MRLLHLGAPDKAWSNAIHEFIGQSFQLRILVGFIHNGIGDLLFGLSTQARSKHSGEHQCFNKNFHTLSFGDEDNKIYAAPKYTVALGVKLEIIPNLVSGVFHYFVTFAF